MTSKDPSAHINDTSSATYFPMWNLKLQKFQNVTWNIFSINIPPIYSKTVKIIVKERTIIITSSTLFKLSILNINFEITNISKTPIPYIGVNGP